MTLTWYHGSPLQLSVLREGSTITQDKHLAEVFSHKPQTVSMSDDGSIKHTGTLPGYLYRVDEQVGDGDVYPHPRSTMSPGKEWLTTRALRLELLGPVEVAEEERLTEKELTALRRRRQGKRANTMIIERAVLEDAPQILSLQKLAYQSEAAIYDDYTIAPLHQTEQEMRADLERQVVLKVVVEGQVVGSVRAYQREGTCYIGRLIVHPDSQNQGIGTRLMREIEAAFPGVGRFELFTGSKSKRNLYLYDKLGYMAYKEQRLTDLVSLVYLEKRRQAD